MRGTGPQARDVQHFAKIAIWPIAFEIATVMTIESRIDAVGNAIRVLVNRLRERGFQFERPADMLPGPESDASALISRLEREVGEVPLAMRLFWLRVGSVDLCGSHPEWHGCEYPDPLVVYPPSVAIEELDDFLKDREERLRCDFPYALPVAPDPKQKANVSGGMWYNLSVPAVADDPALNDEWHRTTFVSYLELAVQWGGFPGLSRCSGHTWPVADLVRDI
jgi:hypothetical protein